MYSCGTRISEIATNLENNLSTLRNWFYANGMVAKPDKFQLMFLGLNEQHKLRLNIEGVKISSTEHVILLGIVFSDRQHRTRLAKPCLRHFKSGDKTNLLIKPPFNFITNFEP